MTEKDDSLDFVGVHQPSSEKLRLATERVGDKFVQDGILRAREKSWRALLDIKQQIREGLTEKEAFQLALEILHGHGASKHWHKPYVRFGPGTALTFHHSLQKEYRLQAGDAFYIDIGPVFLDATTGVEYEGDVGDTFVYGDNAEAQACTLACREVFQLAAKEWQTQSLSGQALYAFIEAEAKQRGYALAEGVYGHRLSDYPHSKYSKERLAAFQNCPSPFYWVLEVQLLVTQAHAEHPVFGAFYEDLLVPTHSVS